MPRIYIDEIKDEFFDEISDSDLIDAIKDRVWDDDTDPTTIFTDQQLVQRGFQPKDEEVDFDRSVIRVREELENCSRGVFRETLCRLLGMDGGVSMDTLMHTLMNRL